MPTARRGIAGGAYVRPISSVQFRLRARERADADFGSRLGPAFVAGLAAAAGANTMAANRLHWRKRAHRRPQRPAHPRRPRHADGRSAAPLLAADRRRQRAREKSGQADPPDGREPGALQGSAAAPSAWSTGIARTAAPTCLTAGSRRAASAAPITAGATTRPAPASISPTRTPPIPSRPRPAARSRPIRCANAPACCGPTWGRCRRPSCRCGSRSTGRTASARSCWPTCRATGSRPRRTPSIPCTSNGCTTTGRTACAATTQTAPKHLKLKFEEFEHGFTYKRVREGQSEEDKLLDHRPRRAVAERLLSRPPLRMARAGRRREHAVGGVVLRPRAEGPRALRAEQRAGLEEPDPGRGRPLDHQPRHQPGHRRLGRAGRHRRPHARSICARATSASP